MKEQFSIVIVCRNEADVIGKTLESIQDASDDIIIYDNGSTDNTTTLVQGFRNVKLHQGPWEGFGKTKQKATELARHPWVLSLDADEALDPQLQQALATVALNNPRVVYNLHFKNFLGNKHLKWGEWGFDSHIRLFHKNLVRWNDAPVHEELVLPEDVTIEKLGGSVLHYTMKDTAEYSRKVVQYALLNAQKYRQQGKKATWVKRYLGPPFAFIKYYFLMLGFLDGWQGLVCAKMTAFYTFLKYARLHELQFLGEEKN